MLLRPSVSAMGRREQSGAEQRARPVIRAPFAADIIRLRRCVPMITAAAAAAAAVNARLPYDEKTSFSDSASSLSLSLSGRHSLSLPPHTPPSSLSLARSLSLSLVERAKGGTLEQIYCYLSSLSHTELAVTFQVPTLETETKKKERKEKKRRLT